MNVPLPDSEKIKIANSDDVFKIMREVLLREHRLGHLQEHFWVIGLNTTNTIVFIELVSLGSVNRAAVHPLDVFSMPVSLKTPKIIFVHNHTGDSVQPSEEDIDTTASLLKGAEMMKIKLLDHIIINPENYHSFKEGGQMQEAIERGDSL